MNKINTTGIAFLSALLIFTGSCSREEKQEKIRELPNVVFIMADDMGIGDTEAYNPESKIPTPHINELAEEGMKFTNTYAPASVCSPTRYGVLTGRYAWRTSLKQRGIPTHKPLLVDTARMTVADLFKKNGYTTAIIGKWHLGLSDEEPVNYLGELKPGPLELGFDYFFGMPASLNMTPFCFIENHYTIGDPIVPKPDSIYGTEGFMVEGWRHEDVGPTFTEKAVEFINAQNANGRKQPFYLHLVTSSPHRPCRPPAFIKGKSDAGKRGDMVVEFDWTVGEVVEALKRNGFLENTLIVVTSDNGAIPGVQDDDGASGSSEWETFGHQPNLDLRGYKTQIWEGGLKVPFIVYWEDKVKEGSISDEIISLSDWFATIADLTNTKYPSDAGEDSYSILPVLLGKDYGKPLREAYVGHSMFGTFAIRKGDWKLIEGTTGGGETNRTFEPIDQEGNPEGQLYNLSDDPREMNNLWNEHPEKVEELSNLLDKYRRTGRSDY